MNDFIETENSEFETRFGSKRVLDHGFVRLVDVMGDDSSIVQAARVSYGKGTKSVNEDRGLIRYLMRHLHTTPFEMVEFKFHCKMPIFVARQWIRHRTANVNEYSGRYSEMKDEFYVPDPEMITTQSATNKQGGTSSMVDGALDEAALFAQEAETNFQIYQRRLGLGMRKELARINLPLSCYTEWYWKIDLHNLFHFLALRLDSHAQYEIRVFAEAMYEMIKPVVPLACEAFEDYRLDAIRLTGPEVRALKEICASFKVDPDKYVDDNLLGNKRETQEFRDKILKIFGG